MDIDPIVLLAYVSVSINIITMIAACIAYAMFHIRKRRRRQGGGAAASSTDASVVPVFLRRCPLPGTIAAVHPTAQAPFAVAKTRSTPLAEVR